MTELHTLTEKKKAFLEHLGMNNVYVWEHDFRQQSVEDPELRNFFVSLDLVDCLDPRNSFIGVRQMLVNYITRLTVKKESDTST